MSDVFRQETILWLLFFDCGLTKPGFLFFDCGLTKPGLVYISRIELAP